MSEGTSLILKNFVLVRHKRTGYKEQRGSDDFDPEGRSHRSQIFFPTM